MFVYYIPATKFHFHISKKKKKQEKKNTQQSFNHRTVTKSWEFLPQTTTTTKTIWLLCGFRGASRWFIRRLRCGDAGGGIRRSTAMNYSFMAEMMGLRAIHCQCRSNITRKNKCICRSTSVSGSFVSGRPSATICRHAMDLPQRQNQSPLCGLQWIWCGVVWFRCWALAATRPCLPALAPYTHQL